MRILVFLLCALLFVGPPAFAQILQTPSSTSGGGGSGTVTSVATTAPISGGTITTTGTITCPTCATGSGTTHMLPQWTNGAGRVLGDSLSFYDAGSSGIGSQAGSAFIGDPIGLVGVQTTIVGSGASTRTAASMQAYTGGPGGASVEVNVDPSQPTVNGIAQIIVSTSGSLFQATGTQTEYDFTGPGGTNAFYPGALTATVGAVPSLGLPTFPWASTVTKILNIPETAAGSLSAAGFGVIYADLTSHTFKVSNNGGAFVALGTGTVTSIATTAPITGGTITTTGTIACATCVTAASALTSNQITKGGGSQALVADTLFTDDGTTLTYAGTGGIKTSGAANGSVTFGNTTNANLVTLLSGVTSATYTLTLPTAVGTTGQVLSLSNGTGTLTFTTPSGGTAITANARNTATQSISDSTVTALTLNTDIDNPQAIHSTSTNTSRMTITTPGIYSVTGRWAPAASAVGTRFCILLVNATTRMAETQFPAPATGAPILECTGIWRFAATDFVELVVFQNSGGALNSTNDSNITPSLSVVFLGS